MITDAVIAEGFKLTLTEIFELLKRKSSSIAKLKSINVDNAYLKASKVEEVKTIWQVDKTVNLGEFYYPSKIQVDSKSIQINSISDLPENGKIIVQGTAGQGKSIFLRYLTGTELKIGRKIPIFVELRKISTKLSIEDLIISSLSSLGIPCDPSTLESIYESNKCVLLLDAFDEIKQEHIQDVISYLDALCTKYHELNVIISARPNSDIQKVSFFRVYDLCPLTPSDFKPMLEKLFVNDESKKADELIKAIHVNRSGISDLITTPLLLTLLTITYKSYNKLPEQLHEFYDNLFHLLVNRHDATKPGFVREYKSGLNENQLEDLFCAFCFFCLLERKDVLSNKDAIQLTGKAKKYLCYENVCENNFLEDAKKNTCLLLEEGFEYHFIHKSIKEYHAASFLARGPVSLKEKFYGMALAESKRLEQVIGFLENIDNYYCSKLFMIPIIENLFESFDYSDSTESVKDLAYRGIIVGLEDGHLRTLAWDKTVYWEHHYFPIIEEVVRCITDWKVNPGYEGKSISVPLEDAYSENYLESIVKKVDEYLNSLRCKYNETKVRIENQDIAIHDIEFV